MKLDDILTLELQNYWFAAVVTTSQDIKYGANIAGKVQIEQEQWPTLH